MIKQLLFIIFVIICFILTIILTSNIFGKGWFIYNDGPYKGKVIDADTGRPIEGAVIGGEWDLYLMGPGQGPLQSFCDRKETITDNNGEFILPRAFCSHLWPFTILGGPHIVVFKHGYFFSRTIAENVKLFKMNHFLDYFPYGDIKRPFYQTNLLFFSQEKSKYLKSSLDKMSRKRFIAKDEKGIFLRVNGSKFTHIYSKKNNLLKQLNNVVFYAYNKVTSDWVVFNRRGKLIKPKKTNLPRWEFMSTDTSLRWPIYANKDSIFYPVEENPMPEGTKYDKSEIIFIVPQVGNISALAGTVSSFMTIEGNGTSLCSYKWFYYIKEKGNPRQLEKNGPRFNKSFIKDDLPDSDYDDTINHTRFKFVIESKGYFFIVTKTKKHWNIYKERRGNFIQIASFPAEREITAFTAKRNELYIAFKNDGIRKYKLHTLGTAISEDTDFFYNSKKASYSEIYSLVIESAGYTEAVYATSGEDKIYRFSLEGIPDYMVQIIG